MNDVLQLYRSIDRLLSAFANFTCECGTSEELDAASHADYCVYRKALEEAESK